MFKRSWMLALLLAGALATAGCVTKKPPAVQPAPNGQPGQVTASPWTRPFEGALTSLKEMNEAGKRTDLAVARERFKTFAGHWAAIRVPIRESDPKLETHIGDGVTELEAEMAKPDDKLRLYELDEETVKIGRLLSQAADLLKVPIRAELVQKDPTMDIPFNREQEVAVTLTEHKIEPAAITLDQHTKVTFVVTNKGKEKHDFMLDHYAVGVEELPPGQTARLTLVLLDAGEFETACHMPGHYEVGMYGKLTVRPAELKKGP